MNSADLLGSKHSSWPNPLIKLNDVRTAIQTTQYVMKKRIFDYSCEEQRTIMLDICKAIYLARNISFSQEAVLTELAKIDTLFSNGGTDEDNGN